MESLNKNIKCNVTECKYHSHDQHYCTLPAIMVTHSVEPTRNKESTNCGSFENKEANNDLS